MQELALVLGLIVILTTLLIAVVVRHEKNDYMLYRNLHKIDSIPCNSDLKCTGLPYLDIYEDQEWIADTPYPLYPTPDSWESVWYDLRRKECCRK